MRTLILYGSGEFTDSITEVDKYILSTLKSSVKNNKIAIIPTASAITGGKDWRSKEKEGNFEGDISQHPWIQGVKKYYQPLGLDAIHVNVTTSDEANDPRYINMIQDCSYLFFSGGDPGYLYEIIFNTVFWGEAYRMYLKNIPLLASSASAMVMSNSILMNARDIKIGKLPKWEKGMGLIDYTIIPHFDKIPYFALKYVLFLTPRSIKKRWIGIDENTVMIISNEKHVLVKGKGKVNVFIDGKKKSYKNDEFFEL